VTVEKNNTMLSEKFISEFSSALRKIKGNLDITSL
jgi:hypothetical protein